jgi:hypothetical protein
MLESPPLKFVAIVLPLLTIAALTLSGLGLAPRFTFIIPFVAEIAVLGALRPRMHKILEAASSKESALSRYGTMLALLENEKFVAFPGGMREIIDDHVMDPSRPEDLRRVARVFCEEKSRAIHNSAETLVARAGHARLSRPIRHLRRGPWNDDGGLKDPRRRAAVGRRHLGAHRRLAHPHDDESPLDALEVVLQRHHQARSARVQ